MASLASKIIYLSGEIPQGDPEGDQRILFRKLNLLSKESRYPILASFLESVTNSLKEEIRRLERSQRLLLPSFETVLHLTDHVTELRKTPLGGAVERVLVLVFQLGSFIAYHEAHPLEYNFNRSNTSFIGRGPGLLSAAAIALSTSILMLPEHAGQITRVTFRFGLIVDQVCRSLEVSPDEINADGAWVYCAHGAEQDAAREAIAAFNAEKNYSPPNQASVFSVDGISASIGGAPSTLRSLFSESEFFKTTTNVPMKKVQGMWHTENAYGFEHVRQTLDGIDLTGEVFLPIYSPVTGEPIEATTATSLVTQIMKEALTQKIRWDLTIDNVSEHLRSAVPEKIALWSVQPSHYLQSVITRWQEELPSAKISTQTIVPEVLELPLGQSSSRDTRSAKLAVVGMACRFPGGADDTDKFWELLVNGRDVHAPVPPDRFNADTHVDPTGQIPNTSKTPYGCFVDNPGLFDSLFFGMSPREAEQTDPMQRLALVTAYEALEHAGYVVDRGGIHRRRVGTFYGQASDDYREVNTGQDISTYFISGGCRAFGPGRINYFFNFWGPSYSIDTACSSSLAAIQAACASLWSGDSDMVLTGGMNILTNSDVYAGLSKGHFLSPTGGCKTWDAGADGYCRADGVGTVVIKRLEDAEADNDNILAMILSAGTDHSAEAVSITHPHDAAQAHLYRQIVERAGIDPDTVGYVEMHGTGTRAGDPTEMRSVTSVFAAKRSRKIPLHIGSVKSNVGHGEAAAGIMAFVKTMLIFKHGELPPHVGIKTKRSPLLPQDLDERGVVIPMAPTPWAHNEAQKRIAMINNFGAAGGNTAMLIEEATPRPRVGEDTRSAYPIAVSAKTPWSLQENLRRLVKFIETTPDLSIADLSYTLTARKTHYNYRVAVLASSTEEAKSLLQARIETAVDVMPVTSKQPPVAFAFTGQGVFYIGIGASLYQDSAEFRAHLTHLDALARKQKFPTFLPVIEKTCRAEDTLMVCKHLAIVCVEIALTRLWASLGVKPSVVIGHSLGEFAALNAAGVLSDSAAIFLVGTRAKLLDAECTPGTHGMLSVRTSLANVETAADRVPFEVACINGPQETVLGGSLADMEKLSAALSKAGHRTVLLDVPHAYHTSQMTDVVEKFSSLTQSVVFKPARIPIISPLHSNIVEADVDSDYLAAATRGTVNFAGALEAAWESGTIGASTVWLEAGHHPALCGFVSRTLSDTRLTCSSLHRDSDSWTSMGKATVALYSAGVELHWDEFHRPFEQALRLVESPTYAWDNKNYWIQYRNDWNLTKGRTDLVAAPQTSSRSRASGFRTSSIHAILEEYSGNEAKITAEVDISDPVLADVVEGHAMNGYGVASSFLHADMAFTMAARIRDQALASSTKTGINVHDFEYHDPVVKPHVPVGALPIIVNAAANLDTGNVHVEWYNPANKKHYAHASVTYEDPSAWLASWSRSATLVTSRISMLENMAATGKADKLTTQLAYNLFGKLVGYSPLYQTMQSVILHEDEAVAEVIFPSDTAGTWTVPPHFIDGVISLSGFILNGGTHFNNTDYFYITPSWTSMRFAKPLTPGGKYLAYVRMVADPVDKNSFAGDVYVLHNNEIIAVTEAIVFRQWPRVMLNRFFRPHAESNALTTQQSTRSSTSRLAPPSMSSSASSFRSASPHDSGLSTPKDGVVSVATPATTLTSTATTKPSKKSPAAATSNVTNEALEIVAKELAVDVRMLTDDAEIAAFGLDSLMSLVLSQMLRDQLKIEIRDAFFLEVETFGDLKKLLR